MTIVPWVPVSLSLPSSPHLQPPVFGHLSLGLWVAEPTESSQQEWEGAQHILGVGQGAMPSSSREEQFQGSQDRSYPLGASNPRGPGNVAVRCDGSGGSSVTQRMAHLPHCPSTRCWSQELRGHCWQKLVSGKLPPPLPALHTHFESVLNFPCVLVTHAGAAAGRRSWGRKRRVGMTVSTCSRPPPRANASLPCPRAHQGLNWGLWLEPNSTEKVGGSAGRQTLA